MTDGIFPIHLAVRSSQGMFMYEIRGKNDAEAHMLLSEEEQSEDTRRHEARCMAFSNDGMYFAFCDGKATLVLKNEDGTWQFHKRFDLPRTSELVFSPDSRYLATWEPYAVYVSQDGGSKNSQTNMRVYDIETATEVFALTQKQKQGWAPQWTGDGQVRMLRQGSELFFVNSSSQQHKGKLVEPGMQSVSLSPGNAPYHVALFVAGSKGQPSKIHLAKVDFHTFPKVSTKMFWKADSVQFKWNSKGTALLCTTTTEVDTSNQSYYGEQQAYLLLTSGDSYKVNLEKNGPVHALDWHPDGEEFVVVYGYMPARTTVFNLRAESLFDMGEGPRNDCLYNTSGNVLILCGFGNLAGNMEFWTTGTPEAPSKRRMIQQMNGVNTTQFAWSADGEHLVTATTAPRLRMDNGLRVWHYTGECIYERLYEAKQELWEVQFRPSSTRRRFEPVFVNAEQRRMAGLDARGKVQANGVHPADGLVNKSGAYVPPHLRAGASGKPSVSVPHLTQTRKPPDGMQAPARPAKSETEKRRLKLEKALQQIEKLKARHQRGEKLEANQLTKIETYDEVVKELASLSAS